MKVTQASYKCKNLENYEIEKYKLKSKNIKKSLWKIP